MPLKSISLNHGYVTLVDDEDFEWAKASTWFIHRGSTKVYARRQTGRKTEMLHRLITNVEPGNYVDHINGDGLDNRRSNLRVCSTAENARNRGASKANTSGFKGVHRNRRRWRAVITVDYNYKHLGTFDTPEDAAKAYDAAAKELHGEFAQLNFPEGESM